MADDNLKYKSGGYSDSRTVEMPVDYMQKDMNKVDSEKHRFPHCIVWTPLPLLT